MWRAVFGMLTVAKVIKTLIAFHATGNFITVLTNIRYLSLYLTRLMQFVPAHTTQLTFLYCPSIYAYAKVLFKFIQIFA